jgi:hypothetical protein
MPIVHVTRTRFFVQLSPSKASVKNNTLAHQKGSHQAQNQASSFPNTSIRGAMRSCHIIPHEENWSAIRYRDCKESEIGHQGLEETSRNANRITLHLQGFRLCSNILSTLAEGFSSLSSFATLQICCCNSVPPCYHDYDSFSVTKHIYPTLYIA